MRRVADAAWRPLIGLAALSVACAAQAAPTVVDYAGLTPDFALAEAKRLDLEPMLAPAVIVPGRVALAASALGGADHDVITAGLMTNNNPIRNPMSLPLAQALAAASADGSLVDAPDRPRAQVRITAASTLLRCVNRHAYAIRCMVTVDLAGSVTPPGESARIVVVSAEHGAAAATKANVARLIALVSQEAAAAFARKAAS